MLLKAWKHGSPRRCRRHFPKDPPVQCTIACIKDKFESDGSLHLERPRLVNPVKEKQLQETLQWSHRILYNIWFVRQKSLNQVPITFWSKIIENVNCNNNSHSKSMIPNRFLAMTHQIISKILVLTVIANCRYSKFYYYSPGGSLKGYWISKEHDIHER